MIGLLAGDALEGLEADDGPKTEDQAEEPLRDGGEDGKLAHPGTAYLPIGILWIG